MTNIWRETYIRQSEVNAIETIRLVPTDKALSLEAEVRSAKGLSTRTVRTGVSSGQRVMISILLRIALARAFRTNLQTLCLDEPTNYLDEDNTRQLADMIGRFTERSHLQVIVITHSALFRDEIVQTAADAKKFQVVIRVAGSQIVEATDE